MDGMRSLLVAMPVLAKVHADLRQITGYTAAAIAPTANHVPAEAARTFAHRAAATIRSWADPGSLADVAASIERLAAGLWTAERPWQHALHRQLVHGDFWNHNVLFDGDKVVAILDLDFMEERPRIDDLALVLYYAYLTAAPPETGGAQARLAALVRAYSEAAEPLLTSAERSVLPFASARTCLHFTGHMALRIREGEQRQVVEANLTEIDWGLAMVSDAKRWHEVFTE